MEGDELQDELVDAAGGVEPTKGPVVVGETSSVTVTIAGCPVLPEPVAQGAPGNGGEPGVIVTVVV
jgi:hypothetical protein